MPLNIPEGYVNHRITINNSLGGPSALATVALAYLTTGTYVQADFARISNLLRDALAPRYDNSFLMGPCRGVGRFGGILGGFDDTGTEAGTHAVQTNTSPAVSIIVSKRTVRIGRSFQGRMFMPWPDEAFVGESGGITGSEVNAWQASMDALVVALLADPAIDSLALLHDVASPHAGTPTEITSLLVRNIVGTMRPRQRR